MKGKRAAALVAAYVLATVVMTWPYANYARFADSSYVGDQQLIIWTLGWDNHALLTGTPLFDSNIYFPAPDSLRYNEHLFGVSLFTLPWAAMGAGPILAHNLTWFLAFPLNGLAAFAFFSRFVTRGLAAFVGSLVCTFGFYVMLHAHAHLHLIWLWTLPFSALLFERWFDSPSLPRLGAWIVITLVALLTSWYVAAMAILVNGIALLTLAATAAPSHPRTAAPSDPRTLAPSHPRTLAPSHLRTLAPSHPRTWPIRIVHLAAAAIVLASCVYPFARHYTGLRAAPGEAAAYAADVASYVIPPQNTLAGRWWLAHVDARPRELFGEQTLFVGWIALALSVAGAVLVVRGRAPRRAWMLLALSLAAFLLSLGPTPAFGAVLAPFNWLAALPGGAGMRAPARFAAVVTIGIAGLAAIGVDAIVSRWPRRGDSIAYVLVPLILAEYFVVGFPAGRPAPQPIPSIYETPELRSARALVSLPEYQGTERWFLGGNYLYYSTAHWRPIVNGFGRATPEGYDEILNSLRAFPANSESLRATGVQYVVVHGDGFPEHGSAVVAAATMSADYRLVRQVGSDYLFEVVSGGPEQPARTR